MREARAPVAAVAAAVLALAGSAATAPSPLPAHVYAPYFETWSADTITGVAQASGARYFTLAFLETLGKSSCTLAWNGSRTDPVSAGRYLGDIASLRSLGGDVIPSFGGWSADQGGKEGADSCKDVKTIARADEDVITRFDVSRLDKIGRGAGWGKGEILGGARSFKKKKRFYNSDVINDIRDKDRVSQHHSTQSQR